MVDRMSVGIGVGGGQPRNVAQVRLAQGVVSIGRHPSSAVHVGHAWMPRRLAAIETTGSHPRFTNGRRTRCVLTSPSIEATLAPSASLQLEPGRWRLAWPELDQECVALVWVDEESTGEDWPELVDRPVDVAQGDRLVMGTHLAAEDLVLTPLRRHRLATLYRYLLDDTRQPENLYATAAAELGVSNEVLRNLTREVRDQLNLQRGVKLHSADKLGYYLVRTSGLVKPSDLRSPATSNGRTPT